MRRRRSIVRTFSVVSLLAIAVVGLLLVSRIQTFSMQQALASSDTTALVIRDLFVQQSFAGRTDVFDAPLAGRDADAAEALVSDRLSETVQSLRIWSTDGDLLWNSEGRNDGALPDRELLNTAVRGEVAHQLHQGLQGEGDQVQNWAPVLGPDGQVIAVLETNLPFAAAQERAWVETRKTAMLVVAGLGGLWLLLFRTVHNASRRLRRSAEENARLALLDPLTGLPNRRLLNERLERAAASGGRTGARIALLLLDVDRFKEVNDTLGHPHGDRLLIQVAERLAHEVRDMDTVARLGGDEFAILLPHVHSVSDAEAFARRVQTIFHEPFDLGDLVLHIDSSIGLAVLPDHADDITTLLQRADVAMYQAKSSGLGQATYASEGDDHSPSRLVLLGDLRQAIGTAQIEMHYQPKVDLKTGAVVGLEALIRWNHPTRGAVPPMDFIPLAERTGLIQALTGRVLEEVLHQVSEWKLEGQALPVAINLSARNLIETDLDRTVHDLLRAYDVEPELIEFEITESAMIEDPVRAGEMMKRLSAMGITVAVDDFGTGYTSMAQLGTMPLRTLKIDRSFVMTLAEEDGGVLVKAIVDLAHEFGLLTVAEGVEDEAIIARLLELNCDVAQGYLWSEPVPAERVGDVVARINAAKRRRKAPVRSRA